MNAEFIWFFYLLCVVVVIIALLVTLLVFRLPRAAEKIPPPPRQSIFQECCCHYCGGTQFYSGPSAGFAENILCANPTCRHWFNDAGPFGFEDLLRIEPADSFPTPVREFYD